MQAPDFHLAFAGHSKNFQRFFRETSPKLPVRQQQDFGNRMANFYDNDRLLNGRGLDYVLHEMRHEAAGSR